MKFKYTMHYLKNLYIFFIILSLTLFFFSTTKVEVKAFEIKNIEISKPFKNDFNKNLAIDVGFRNAFSELLTALLKSSDLKKIDKAGLNEIKSMIDSFSIQEEKFINQNYYLNLGVSFNKKKVYAFLEKRNIFPSQIIKETFLFIPIVIDEDTNSLKIFSENLIYNNWNKFENKSQLINYLLLTEDLEDMNLIKKNSQLIEEYDFSEIKKKYFLKNSIISLIFKKDKEINILSKINIQGNKIIKNNSFENIEFENEKKLESFIGEIKTIYEDIWKEHNQINTSIQLPLLIRVDNDYNNITSKFEITLEKIDLVNNYKIDRFDKDFIYYEIIFNGTTNNFIKIMNNNNYEFNTQNKIWILK